MLPKGCSTSLQERQFAAEQKARLRYGMELKIMREGHISARQQQRGWQDDNRPRLTQQRVDHHQREAVRTLQQDRPHEANPLAWAPNIVVRAPRAGLVKVSSRRELKAHGLG
jgi:hypothetical protein